MFEELQQPANAALVTRNIGDALSAAKRYEQAEAAYLQAAETYREIGDRVAEAGTINSMGVLEEERQQWDAAIEWYERARGVFEELNQPANVAFVTRNIGDALRDAKRYDESQGAYHQAIDAFQEILDFEEQSESLFALGNLYRTWNKADAAKASYQQATQLYDRNWDAHLALGLLQLDDEPEQAEHACQRALDGFPVHQILAHVGLAVVAAGREDLSQAEAEIETARSLLAVAQEKYTVVESQLEALRIVIGALDAPEQALQDSEAFDLTAVPIDERDLIEIAFGYLSILVKWLLSDS